MNEILLLFLPRTFPQLMHQSTNALSKIQFIRIINVLHVSAPGCHPQGVFRAKEYEIKTLIWFQ